MSFAPQFPIRTAADVRRLEETPLESALTQRSTYEIFCESARAFGEKTALTLTSLAAGSEVLIPTTSLFRNRKVLSNYWRLVERYRCTVVSAVPTVLEALANTPVGTADISTLRYCRTGAG
jgi:hypothetical protein